MGSVIRLAEVAPEHVGATSPWWMHRSVELLESELTQLREGRAALARRIMRLRVAEQRAGETSPVRERFEDLHEQVTRELDLAERELRRHRNERG